MPVLPGLVALEAENAGDLVTGHRGLVSGCGGCIQCWGGVGGLGGSSYGLLTWSHYNAENND